MSDTDEARAEAEQRFRVPRMHVGTVVDREVSAFVAGAAWQRSRDVAEVADLTAQLVEAEERVVRLAGRLALTQIDRDKARDQLQAAQATIAEARGVFPNQNRLDEYGETPLRWSIRKAHDILSRAD